MRPTSKIIQDVKDVLNFEGHIDRELLFELSDEYAGACDRVVDRAYRCRQLQQKGMRRQAVQLAHQAPDLRREFHAVDFAAAPAWHDYCEREGLKLPPILETEVIAAVIDEVYAESANLHRLVRVHRRMALGRAPLADRLKVLRRICRADPKDSGWRAEILNYETARVEELVEQARAADQAGDLPAIEAVLGELRSEHWLSLPPEQFITEADLLAQPHRRQTAGKEFASLRERIVQARQAMDQSECRRLLQEAASLAARASVQPDAATAEQLADAQRWLDGAQGGPGREDPYEQACAALGQALGTGAPAARVRRLASEVLAFGRGMPDSLSAQLRAGLARRRRTSRRKTALIVIGVLVGLSLAAVTLVTAMRHG